MKNFTVESNNLTFTILADSYKILNDEYIFEASGVEIKRFNKNEVKNVLTENAIHGDDYYELIKS
jgi:hypothetical protein